MTGLEETIDLDEELQRLQDERAELVEQTADLHPDDPHASRLEKRGKTLDTHIEAVEWAREEAHTDAALPTRDGSGKPLPVWNEPADELTFSALSGGVLARIEDRVASKAASNDLRSTTGLSRINTVAFGTVDAPYHDPEADRDQQVRAVSQLPHPFLKWAEATILDLSMLGNGSGTSFAAAVKERRQTETDDPTPST